MTRSNDTSEALRAALPVAARSNATASDLTIEQLHAAALRGDVSAQAALGHCYLHGDGVKADSSEAVRWYRLAAAQHSGDAAGCLGFCFEHGIGVARDRAAAAEWYRRATQSTATRLP